MKIRATLACLALAGCVTPAAPVQMVSTFDPAEVAWSRGKGDATLEGSALLRTRGGDVRTCAGYPVSLTPESKYAAERMMVLFKGGSEGYLPVMMYVAPPTFASTDPGYTASVREVTCDPQGKFVFKDIPAGNYFVTTKVYWEVPQQYVSEPQGGTLMKAVKLEAGEAKSVVLTVN